MTGKWNRRKYATSKFPMQKVCGGLYATLLTQRRQSGTLVIGERGGSTNWVDESGLFCALVVYLTTLWPLLASLLEENKKRMQQKKMQPHCPCFLQSLVRLVLLFKPTYMRLLRNLFSDCFQSQMMSVNTECLGKRGNVTLRYETGIATRWGRLQLSIRTLLNSSKRGM